MIHRRRCCGRRRSFCVLLAFGARGKPAVVMSIVFAGAPIVNAVTALVVHPPAGGLSAVRWQFLAGIVCAALWPDPSLGAPTNCAWSTTVDASDAAKAYAVCVGEVAGGRASNSRIAIWAFIAAMSKGTPLPAVGVTVPLRSLYFLGSGGANPW